jgi:GR25 family glycosyltransferase involved in LPS biosynthesis
MITPLTEMGFDVELFEGTYGNDIDKLLKKDRRQLHPTTHENTPTEYNFKLCSPGVIGCFYSHYRLWKKCLELNQPIFIFEDDVEFIQPYYPVEFKGILIVALGSWLVHDIDLNPPFPQYAKHYKGSCMPGAVGYGITPKAAKKLVKEYRNTYIAADSAIRTSVVDIKIHSHIIGRALLEKDGKVSLTKYKGWK